MLHVGPDDSGVCIDSDPAFDVVRCVSSCSKKQGRTPSLCHAEDCSEFGSFLKSCGTSAQETAAN